MLASVQNDTSSRSSPTNWLAGRGVPTKSHKAKKTHGRHAAQKIPSSMIAGESYGVSVSMKNIGSTTWTPSGLYRLGSQDPEDNGTWGMGRVVMPVASAAPGDTVEFVWTVTAPLTPGSYAFQWEMVQDGVEHFGDFSPLITVAVAASELAVPDGLLNAVWDSDNLLLELDGALSTTGRCTDSPGMWGGLVSECQSAQLINSWDAAGSSFYGYDSQSSTRLLTNASGVVTDNYAYRAFGTEWQSGNGSWNSYRYVGQYGCYRDCAAMQYVRARYLDVQAGRWVSRDPIGYDGGDWNLYRYVGNDVVDRMDASGLADCTCGCGRKNCYCKDPYCKNCQSSGILPLPSRCNNKKWDHCIDYAISKYCKNCSKYHNSPPTRHKMLCEIYAESDCKPDASNGENKGLLQISYDVWLHHHCSKIGTWEQVQKDPCKNIECSIKALCAKSFRCDSCRWGTNCAPGNKFDCCRRCYQF